MFFACHGKWPLLYQVWQKGHFTAKGQMATFYQAWQMATLLIWQWPNLFLADGHTVAQSLSIMVIAYVFRVKNG